MFCRDNFPCTPQRGCRPILCSIAARPWRTVLIGEEEAREGGRPVVCLSSLSMRIFIATRDTRRTSAPGRNLFRQTYGSPSRFLHVCRGFARLREAQGYVGSGCQLSARLLSPARHRFAAALFPVNKVTSAPVS